jgi:hypothetical membrane protein
MLDKRVRWGAPAWVLTLQFFVAETVAGLRFDGYSWTGDVISDLGASSSPAAGLMNASFVLQGVLIVTGVVLLRGVLPGLAGRLATVLLGVAGIGVLVVGLFPLDAQGDVHAVGAVTYLVGSSLGLLALAHTLRPRSEALGSAVAVMGVVATAMSVFFLAGITRFLGDGGTERAAAYLLPVALALVGVALWRGAATLSAERPADRDAPCERHAAEAAVGSADDGTSDDEDPWAPSVRRRD